ncbi:accessory gene regulator ArgB-like protein [Paenibacillus medicaginis]|uniref:Accessory gene regulator ArgB-like protein n=1 Tax=Paenibacillus medicaginis TaxID=1470560 RepID=A0ABV5C0X9_9BACL
MAVHIKNTVPDHPSSVVVLKYGISILINTLSTIFITLFISSLLGTTIDALIAMISFAFLRQLTGGIHIKSSGLCIVVSSAMLILIPLLQVDSKFIIPMSIVSIVLIILYAPSRVERQTRIPKEKYYLLRIAGVLLIVINLFLSSTIVAISFCIQSLTLIGRR